MTNEEQNIVYKTYRHNPPHLFVPNAKYFITSGTYHKQYYLQSRQAKEILIDSIIRGFTDQNWLVEDWVILDNHYHVIVNASEEAARLSKIMQTIHKFSSNILSKSIPELRIIKKIWHNYWDTCLTYEKSYYARIHYLWFNPVRHGCVDNPEKWEYGSYYYRIKEGKNNVNKIIKEYPIDKIKVKDDF